MKFLMKHIIKKYVFQSTNIDSGKDKVDGRASDK
jgi:hypothetical protein